jgi:NOL1/NOP2/sun family putative RNA methylase
MKLPEEFLNKMKIFLGEEEYKKFKLSYDRPRNFGIRVNTLKIDIEKFLEIIPFKLERIPWTKDGYYYEENERPGKHPYYYSGLFYIQEPSAMYPALVLDAKPGEYILDLCAAPGGKTAQIAAGMKGLGLLVSNDPNPQRIKALVKNIELLGIKNTLVTNEFPEKLSLKFTEYFDKILVDAPCSGEGMFRKDENAIKNWDLKKCEDYVKVQEKLLEYAHVMLKPGGRLVYSTCTFSPEENEGVLASFLKKHKDYRTIEIPLTKGIEKNKTLTNTVRLWPHKVRGEGHFAALLQKRNSNCKTVIDRKQEILQDIIDLPKKEHEEHGLFSEFVSKNLNVKIEGRIVLRGNSLYHIPVSLPNLDGIKVAKYGWHLGRFLKGTRNIKNIFEPSQSMITALEKNDLKHSINLDSRSLEAVKYLKGETLIIGGEKGYVGVCIDGFTVGWAKQMGNMLKNLYPKGWRKIRE